MKGLAQTTSQQQSLDQLRSSHLISSFLETLEDSFSCANPAHYSFPNLNTVAQIPTHKLDTQAERGGNDDDDVEENNKKKKFYLMIVYDGPDAFQTHPI